MDVHLLDHENQLLYLTGVSLWFELCGMIWKVLPYMSRMTMTILVMDDAVALRE